MRYGRKRRGRFSRRRSGRVRRRRRKGSSRTYRISRGGIRL